MKRDAGRRREAKRDEERFGKFGNVAIKREQRLLADYAEREQRKDCEAGLMMGVE